MKYVLKITLLVIQLLFLKGEETKTSKPHIIIIYVDDVGWNDVSYHGSAEIPTPNIDALAMSGILLNNYYGFWICSPSRAALLSARYPTRMGLQHSIILTGEASGMPLDIVTMPQHLKNLGYSTHIVGKWHVGYMKKEYTPLYRGFDTFFGYYNAYIDYYDFTHWEPSAFKDVPHYYGIDLHNGTDVVKDFRGRYATEVFTEKAEDIIRNHNQSQPLFLYLSHLAAHFGNPYDFLPTPPQYIERVKYIKDLNRRRKGGILSAMDDSVGIVFRALSETGMLENSIIVFASDNGGVSESEGDTAGSNFPLRGEKETLWDGGNRVPAIIWSPLLNLQEPRISMQMMHVTDWLPTLYSAAGGNVKDLSNIDGVDMWEALLQDLPSPRKEILYNIDPIYDTGAIRVGDMKVIYGTTGYDSWYKPKTFNDRGVPNATTDKLPIEEGSIIYDLLVDSGRWNIRDVDEWRNKATVTCSQPPPLKDGGGCNPKEKPCLYNLADDPCEYNNLADKFPEIVENLLDALHVHEHQALPPQHKLNDPNANPECHNFTHIPWLDPEHFTECTVYFHSA